MIVVTSRVQIKLTDEFTMEIFDGTCDSGLNDQSCTIRIGTLNDKTVKVPFGRFGVMTLYLSLRDDSNSSPQRSVCRHGGHDIVYCTAVRSDTRAR